MKSRKFSTFLKKLFIQLDENLYPNNNLIEVLLS